MIDYKKALFIQKESDEAMPKTEKLISKGRSGIGLFIFIYVLVVGVSSFKFDGSTLFLNVVIHGTFALVLIICIYFLVEHPFKALSVSLVLCGLDTLRLIFIRFYDVLNYRGIEEIIPLIIGGGLRLIGLWAIWSALIGMKKNMGSQDSPAVE